MDRIESTTPNVALDKFGEGKHGRRDTDRALGIRGTQVKSGDIDAVQEELMAIIEGAGIEPDRDDLGQVLQAIRSLISDEVAPEPVLVDGAYTATFNERVLRIDASAGAFDVALPDPALVPRKYLTIKKIAGAHQVNITSADGVDGESSIPLRADYRDSFRIYCTGSTYEIH